MTPNECESEDAHNKKSPHTRRVIKRGRTTRPQDEDAQLFLPSLPSSPNSGPPVEPQSSTPQPPTPIQVVIVEQTRRLEVLLDSVLATPAIIQSASTTPVDLCDHFRHALQCSLNWLSLLST